MNPPWEKFLQLLHITLSQKRHGVNQAHGVEFGMQTHQWFLQ